MPDPLHGCPGCGTQVRRSQLACRTCWWRLPQDQRDTVNQAWAKLRRNPTAAAAATAHRVAIAQAMRWYREQRSH